MSIRTMTLLLLLASWLLPAHGVLVSEQSSELPSLQKLPLPAGVRTRIQQALQSKDFTTVEELLVKETEAKPKSPELLTFLGSIFFLDGKYLNSAVAFKKAEALSPLDESSRFTLAMAYVVLDKRDWARPELEGLRAAHPENPSYWYWLARLAYDAQQFKEGIARFQKAIELDSKFAKAYDNLGLCYEGLGQYDEALRSYQKAVELNREFPLRSGWPALNLGMLLAKLGRVDEAESYLNESLRHNPNLAQGHYQLGMILEKKDRLEQAIQELQKAATLDDFYSEPHYALGRIYRRRGQRKEAEAALAAFERLKAVKRSRSDPRATSQRQETSSEAARGPL
ncbi:MAG: tetratricopeptide repeat protein [Acidobacteria bacterium]|nr:tetratricopeptide repeat protein [Acidobacteriota bacterium]